MKTSALLAAVLAASVIASAGVFAFGVPRSAQGPTESGDGRPPYEAPPEGWQDPPEIDVSWARSGMDVVVTFTQVDEPKLLDCAWHADVFDDGSGDWRPFAQGNFTDREAWRESSLYSNCYNPDWAGPEDPPWPEPWEAEGFALFDADDDNRLSAGDTLTVFDVGAEEADLRLVIAFWGSWFYEFRWHAGSAGDPSI